MEEKQLERVECSVVRRTQVIRGMNSGCVCECPCMVMCRGDASSVLWQVVYSGVLVSMLWRRC